MDELTRQSIARILRAGMAELTTVQEQLLKALYFEEMRAIKRHFRERHQMNGKQFDRIHEQALENLKKCLGQWRINQICDVL